MNKDGADKNSIYNPMPTLKRFQDVTLAGVPILASAFAVVNSPLLSLSVASTFLAVSSIVHRANPFFSQPRVGKDGQDFTIFKLTTRLRPYDPRTGKKREPEDCKTRLGEKMRTFKVDEVPQIFMNVAKGDMSFVGPRALLRGTGKDDGTNIELHPTRTKHVPGLVEFGYLFGPPNEMSNEQRLRYDTIYDNCVKDLSSVARVTFDSLVLMKTPAAIIKHRNSRTDSAIGTQIATQNNDDNAPKPS